MTVCFAETDAAGIAHHSAFLIWFEAARDLRFICPSHYLPGKQGGGAF